MTRALIADDEPHLALYLRDQLLALWPDLQIIQMARNGVEAAARIAELEPDIAFLDIQMPGLSGLEVAQGIEGPTRVVFVTAYDEFAVQAFEHAALDYVLKPVTTERLARTVARLRCAPPLPPASAAMAQALRQLTATPGPARPRLRYILASRGEHTHHLDVAKVRFFHADDKYTVVASVDGEFLIRTPITELAAQLDPEQFWQVHRSTLINLAWLDGTRRDDASRLFVRMRGHAGELPVSRAFVHLFRAM
ncbi:MULTISPECIES: LytTR family DNA-binding domain-containing protein [unclassified Janthinobacterium]|uniref:LytR/AlgR family response regulator transcription factor n=1 Tax=unclassified Janthinobacterium TaxID=2610881 RepID=UPI00088CE359|nr:MULTISPECIES: LytTR family DNA-binding domain-containing protein [unclassified Janthinobacterium]SDA57331.1 two component transcriptional regulator, LytTR family [Janthinobacterium sp. 551a]SFB27977.1 two component transcriptional regulator, LytTR family [Janthinobacterium sp. 344]